MLQIDCPFRNLVFEGGGVMEIAYFGALGILDERDILSKIHRIGGASAGAINASLLALEYTVGEVRDILAGLDFNDFEDDNFGIIRVSKRLFQEFGWTWKTSSVTGSENSSRKNKPVQ